LAMSDVDRSICVDPSHEIHHERRVEGNPRSKRSSHDQRRIAEPSIRYLLRWWTMALSLMAACTLLSFAPNEVLVTRPVRAALPADSRNATFTLRANYRWYLMSSTLVLDLTRVDTAALVDLFRTFFSICGYSRCCETTF
jgi:hypothetical protein